MNPEYSLEGLMLKLKLQYFVHLMWRADSPENTLMLGKTEGRRERGWQRTICWRTGKPGVLPSTRLHKSVMTEWLNNSNKWQCTNLNSRYAYLLETDWINQKLFSSLNYRVMTITQRELKYSDFNMATHKF